MATTPSGETVTTKYGMPFGETVDRCFGLLLSLWHATHTSTSERCLEPGGVLPLQTKPAVINGASLRGAYIDLETAEHHAGQQNKEPDQEGLKAVGTYHWDRHVGVAN